MARKNSSSAGGRTSGRSSNDQRANVRNPKSREHKAATDNRANQKNPNNPEYQGPQRSK